MSRELSAIDLVVGDTYFLVGYLDKELRVPFIQTLIYRESKDAVNGETGLNQHGHLFVDAIDWHREREKNGDKIVDPTWLGEDGATSPAEIWIYDDGLDCIKDYRGLVAELNEQLGPRSA